MRTHRYVTARYLLVLACGLVLAAPLLFMVSGSLMSASELTSSPPSLLPEDPVWSNYSVAWGFIGGRVVVNTIAFSLGVVLLQLVVSLPAAFALAKIPFRAAVLVLALLVVPMLVPANLTLIPLFVVTFQLGWLDTYAGLIVPVAGQCAFAILLFRQFFVTLPDGLIEAARIDGAGWGRILWAIGIPLSRPVLATFGSVTFLTAWNMYIWPQIIAPSPEHRVMNVALAPVAQGNALFPPGVGLAGAAMAMLPVLLVFVVFQKWYVNGVVGTGVE